LSLNTCGAGDLTAAGQATYSNHGCSNPNNFPRLLDLCRSRLEYVQREISATATDDETLAEMKSFWERYRYITDPHTAVDSRWKRTNASIPSLAGCTGYCARGKVCGSGGEALDTPPLPDRLRLI